MAAYETATLYDATDVYAGITSRPTLRVRLATDFSGTTATDITSSVRRVRINRGRGPLAFDRFDPGRCTLELVDFDSTFFPEANSQLRINTPVAVDMLWGTEEVSLFYGFCDEVQTQWVKGASVAYTSMTFTDGMKLLAKATTTVDGVTGDRPAQRLLAYLESINLGSSPTGMVDYEGVTAYDSDGVYGGEYTSRSLDTLTDVTLQVDATDRRAALTAAQRVELAEAGALFFDGRGRCCFRGRGLAWPVGNPVVAFSDVADSSGGWGSGFWGDGFWGDDGPSERSATYTAIRAVTDEQLLYNRVTVTRDGGVEQLAEDTASQAALFTRDLNQTGVIVADDGQAATLAAFLLEKRKLPTDRYEQLDMAAYASDANLYAALNLDLLSVVSLVRSAPSYDSATVQVVAGLQHDISPMDWRVSYSTQARA